MKLVSTVISYNDTDIIAKAPKGVATKFRNEGWQYKYRIVIECNGVKKSFAYHNANGKEYLKTDEIEDAVMCIFDDATAYINSPTLFDFLNDFGYSDYDNKEGKQAFQGCLRTYLKLKQMGLSEDDMFGICNLLRNKQR